MPLTALTTPAATDTNDVKASTTTPIPRATPANAVPPNVPSACPTICKTGANGAAADLN